MTKLPVFGARAPVLPMTDTTENVVRGDRELQVTGHGAGYARPYVNVGAFTGIDEEVLMVVASHDAGEEPRPL